MACQIGCELFLGPQVCYTLSNEDLRIDHFTVVCLVSWPLNESEAGVDLVLLQTSLLFLCKFQLIGLRKASLTFLIVRAVVLVNTGSFCASYTTESPLKVSIF